MGSGFAAENWASDQPRLLLVEDSTVLLPALTSLLTGEGYEVVTSTDGVDAIEAVVAGGPFDVVVTDFRIPRVDGAELVIHLHSTLDDPPPVVIYTGHPADEGRLATVLELPGVRYVWKGQPVDSLVKAVRLAAPP